LQGQLPLARYACPAFNERKIMTSTTKQVLYTGKTSTTGGRKGVSRSSDGNLDITLSPPGSHGTGTNPEQLFAAGWSACFIGAIGKAATTLAVDLPVGLAVDAEVDLCNADGVYSLQARLKVRLPGLAPEMARTLVDMAHQTCPYSKMSRNNIDVEITIADLSA
jgi:osmotically inducible protein OsmC